VSNLEALEASGSLQPSLAPMRLHLRPRSRSLTPQNTFIRAVTSAYASVRTRLHSDPPQVVKWRFSQHARTSPQRTVKSYPPSLCQLPDSIQIDDEPAHISLAAAQHIGAWEILFTDSYWMRQLNLVIDALRDGCSSIVIAKLNDT
jgi:hypothetical protein